MENPSIRVFSDQVQGVSFEELRKALDSSVRCQQSHTHTFVNSYNTLV